MSDNKTLSPDGPSDPGEPKPALANSPSGLGKTILYIEDDELSVMLVERALQVYGYEVRSALTVTDGLAAVETTRLALMLINLDLLESGNPSDSGGPKLALAWIRQYERLADLPVVALTSQRGPGARQRSLEAGFNGHLSKPIKIEDLPAQLEPFLGHYLLGSPSGLSQSPDHEGTTYLQAYKAQLAEKLEERVRELSESNQRLLDTEKESGQFLLAVSNQLRRPWAPIQGYLELLLNDTFGELSQAQRDVLQTIAKQVEGVSPLLDRLLDFSELKADCMILERVYFDFNLLIKEVLHMTKARQHEKAGPGSSSDLGNPGQVVFDYRADQRLGKVYGDRNRIKQVILTLLHHAAKVEGPAPAKAAGTTRPGKISLTALIKEDYLEFKVNDIKYGAMQAAARGGSGRFWPPEKMLAGGDAAAIGLFISKFVVEAHQGEMWMEPMSEGGASLFFTIPLEAPTVAEEALLSR